jgi:hypothetical protein
VRKIVVRGRLISSIYDKKEGLKWSRRKPEKVLTVDLLCI